MGVVLLAESAARALAARRPRRYLLSWTALADLLVIATLVVPVFLDQLAFLRLLRAVRLLHSRIVLRRLGRLFPRLRHRRSSVQAAVDLVAFVTSALVHVRQHPVNPRIATMADAVPFTVAAFTTSGFGDVVPVGTAGRVLAVAITIVGISLLIRCAVSAPIDGRGTVVWSCFPRFDGDPVFCHLVDEGGERGFFAVDFPDLQNVEQRHLPHTAVLETVLRDGMDPAALEDITAQDPGVPVVSRFAGCARHLEGVLTVNPYDIRQVAQELHRALTMPLSGRIAMWQQAMAAAERHDIHRWRRVFLGELAGPDFAKIFGEEAALDEDGSE